MIMSRSGTCNAAPSSLQLTQTSYEEITMAHQIKSEPGMIGYLLILVIFASIAGPALI